MIDETGCDAVMLGRATLGNPWLIKEIVEYFNYGELPKQTTKEEKIKMCIKHMEYLLEFKSEKQAILEMRSHISWYMKGLDGVNEIKNKVFKATTKKEVLKILGEFSQ